MTESKNQPQQEFAKHPGAASEDEAAWGVHHSSSGTLTHASVSAQAAIDVPPREDVLDTTESSQEESPSASWLILRELAETIVLSLIIFLLMRQVVQNYRIESHSMEPNFSEGQFILVNKLAYVLGAPQRGDVLVFHNPTNPEEDYIKRIIGLPGDTVSISGQHVYINGELMGEPYIANQIRLNEQLPPQLIEPDHLYVMGDNRPNSSDSRRFGQLSQDLVVGKAWLRVWPPDKWGLVGHADPHIGSAQAVLP